MRKMEKFQRAKLLGRGKKWTPKKILFADKIFSHLLTTVELNKT